MSILKKAWSYFTLSIAIALAALPAVADPPSPSSSAALSPEAQLQARKRLAESLAFHLMTPERPERVINFPQAYSIGTISIGKKIFKAQLGGQPARGKVVVPAGMTTRFVPSKDFIRDPSVINSLPPDAFDSIKLSTMSLDDSEDGWCDRALSYLGHMKGLIELDIERSDATDKGAAVAAQLPNLQRLAAFEAAVDGGFFKQLSGLKNLRCLDVSANPIKAENIKYLAGLPQLQYFHANGCGLDDQSIRAIASCKSLENLSVSENPGITEKSIPYFLNLKKLRLLNLAHTSINPKEVIRFKALPALALLGMPHKPLLKAEYDQIGAALPRVLLTVPGDKSKKMDGDNTVLFSPLH